MSARTLLLIVFFAMTGIGLAAVVLLRPPQPLELQAGTALEVPRDLVEFELVDHAGRPFSRSRLEGRWSLLFLGFTHCPDICPATLAQLDSLQRRLGPDGGDIQVVLLTADPERDTPERLAEYLGFFNPEFVGVTGPRPEIDRLCESLGLAYVHFPLGRDEYTVDHSAGIVLIDPRGRMAGYFRQPLDLPAMARDLAAIAATR